MSLIVKDIIEKLQKCDPNSLICVDIVKELRENKVFEDIYDNTSIELVGVSTWVSGMGTSYATLQLGTTHMVEGKVPFTPSMVKDEVML